VATDKRAAWEQVDGRGRAGGGGGGQACVGIFDCVSISRVFSESILLCSRMAGMWL
jgi:hypothetical protein